MSDQKMLSAAGVFRVACLNDGNELEIGLVGVKTSDPIRISYDFEREGWVIKQLELIPLYKDGPTDGGEQVWHEVAFFDSWAFEIKPHRSGLPRDPP